ncbi:MAG: sodium:solute symporter family protein [Synergistaceae bacterium]|jgi:SSS family solute:Na+ symporter|nr:sodium:solute symporter family protein [Synergistaceae bacterium]
MSVLHYVGAVAVLVLITAVGIYSSKRVRTAGDFNTGGRRAGAGIVMGSMIGTLVGGASTIGTAQLAFSYGFSAWWFTLGGGLGCLALAVCFSGPLYESGISTMPQIFAREYGQSSSTVATLLTSMGSFLSIVSQVLSGVALITSVSGMGALASTFVIALLMLAYVVFGGVWGVGYVGVAKTLLLYVSVAVCGVTAVRLQGGISVFRALLPADRYFNLFARGFAVDMGAGLSLVVGVLTTQSYIQALISARSLRASRAGILASALLIPFVGVAGIFVGMYMKLNFPDIAPGSALPLFIMRHLPPLAGGVALATLLVGVIGTGAGMALGLSSMIGNDIYGVYINKNASDRRNLLMSRLIIVMILACAVLFSTGNLGSLILGWSFLSMGLRGAVAFGPLCAAIFLKNRISAECAIAAMVAGPLFVLAGKFALPAVDPLFPGMAANIVVLGIGLAMKKPGTSET